MFVILAIQGVLLLLLVCNTPWISLVYCGLFLGSFLLPPFLERSKTDAAKTNKPLKTKEILKKLYPPISNDEKVQLVTDRVIGLVLYDPENTASLANFEIVKSHSNCVFARKARIWGSPEWKDILSLEGNIIRMLPQFLKFSLLCPTEKQDGFLLELPGKPYGTSVQSFGDALYTVLKILSDFDPAGFHCMDKSYVHRSGWVFRFNKVTFFITTFAPFYPENHARYCFGAENCYILFQPELSFAHHDLPSDTLETNWENPETVRDRIRVAFKMAGRQYKIPNTLSSPMVLGMIPPVSADEPVYEWWKPRHSKDMSNGKDTVT